MRPIDPADLPAGSFQGLLLAAHPDLKDPNFRRAVLLLSLHDTASGALGFALNRPLSQTAADLLPDHPQRALLQRIPVFLGGPVGHGAMSFADLAWDKKAKTLRLDTNLSLDELPRRLDQDPSGVRAFVGYAGWSAGQLEGELSGNAWVLIPPSLEVTTEHPVERLWFRIMGSLGPAYKLQAAVPDDPSLN